jgi:sedoheptulokinase
MNRLAAEAYKEKDRLQVQTTFAGTRNNPHLRGTVGNIGENNFTPGQLVLGTMRGMADELHAMYQPFADGKRDMLIASGNAVDRNAVLRKVLSDTFGMTLHMPSVREAAAFGAALLAALSAGIAETEDVKACIFCHADEVMN